MANNLLTLAQFCLWLRLCVRMRDKDQSWLVSLTAGGTRCYTKPEQFTVLDLTVLICVSLSRHLVWNKFPLILNFKRRVELDLFCYPTSMNVFLFKWKQPQDLKTLVPPYTECTSHEFEKKTCLSFFCVALETYNSSYVTLSGAYTFVHSEKSIAPAYIAPNQQYHSIAPVASAPRVCIAYKSVVYGCMYVCRYTKKSKVICGSS